MSKKSLFVSFLLFPALALAGDPVLLKKISGTVEIKAGDAAAWNQAQAGSEIPSGGKLRTGADGRAELKFKNKASVWLKPSTSVALEQKGPKDNRITLASGSLKVRVPHLKFRERFEVKSPVAVASVRGTVFSIDEQKVQTFFGHVNMLLPDGKKVEVPQGTGFDGQALSLLSQVDEAMGLQDWSPGLSDEQRVAELNQFVENRQQIRDYANDALARNAELIDSLADNVKDADFAAGRTLTDVHGNLVRVEQRLDRPAPDTIQVLNVVLRKSYASGGLRHYAYNGANTSRVDALIAKSDFNMNLPDAISDFPGFFSANEDTLKIDHATLIAANLSNPQEIGVVAYMGDRPSLTQPGATDDINADLYVGDLTNGTDAQGRAELFNLNAGNAVGAGLSKYKEATADTINFDAPGGELYGRTAKKFDRVAGSGAGHLWIATENFVINNNGQVRNVNDYTGGGANFQELLSNSAGQTVIFVKDDAGLVPGTGDVLANGKNIDLVIIPDLFYSIVKTLGPTADAFGSTH